MTDTPQTSSRKKRDVKRTVAYILTIVGVLVLGYFEIGNLFTAFLGVMGLKFSAYAQPLLNKIVNKFNGSYDATSGDENSEVEKINKEVTM